MWRYFGKSKPNFKSGYEFKMKYPFDRRKRESDRVKEKYPTKVPIIIEKEDNTRLPSCRKQKILVEKDITVGQFLYIIRKNIDLDSSQALFMFVNESCIPASDALLGEVYNKYQDKDGFLYVLYSAENTFG